MSETTARTLDPFGFFIGHASCIKPLGGTQRGPDPAYAFHTAYMDYRPGPVVFTLRFEGLQAKFGELVIHVNSFVPGSGAHALLVTMSRVSMTELARSGAEITVRINALADVGFAIFGYFPEGTDATAAGLTITADELGTDEDAKAPADLLQPTRFGRTDLHRPAALVTSDRPTFHSPVSQTMTASQIDEDAYRACVRALALDGTSPASDWKQAFVLQTLDCYGLIEAHAHGLALGDSESPLAAALVARSCPITSALHVIDEGSATDSSRRRFPALCPDALFDARCLARNFDPRAIDDDLRGFDFLWSIDMATRLGSVADGRAFLQQSLRCLRPGGIAVHMFDILARGEASDADQAISRQRIEAIALTLISKGNDVAQLNFGDGAQALASADGTAPFGLIVRRGG